VTPAFLTKVTDAEPRILALLKRRVFELYNFAPDGEPTVHGYEHLVWAPPLPPVARFESVLSDRLCNANGSISIAVRKFGWCFNGFAGDPWKSSQERRLALASD
jgi:hypothetical protein